MDCNSPVSISRRHPNLSPHASETEARMEDRERYRRHHDHWPFSDFEDAFVVGQGSGEAGLELCDSIAASYEYKERGNTKAVRVEELEAA